QVAAGAEAQDAAGGQDQLQGGAGRRGEQADGHEAGRVAGGRRGVVSQATPPGVEGGGRDLLAGAESGDAQAAAAEALEALLPAAAGGGIRTATGLRRGRHGGSSQRQGPATSLLDLSIT